ncbi:MAG: kelch repeat-containing protein [archaeon]|nr:kelch repeat-containing protein [archaeon]
MYPKILYQILEVKPNKKTKPNTNFKSNPTMTSLVLNEFDLTDLHFTATPINLRIITSLEGISQVTSINKHFLCGNTSFEKDSISTGGTMGASLIEIKKPYTDNKDIKYLINSKYSHFYPSLFCYECNTIFVIGGREQIKCESYSLITEKWKDLPDLPEERYQCGLMTDKNEEFLYLFGGKHKNEEITKFVIPNNILRLYIKGSFSTWEKIQLTENKNLLRRTNVMTMKSTNSNLIYILGGSDPTDENNLYDDIISYDCFCRILQSSHYKLKKKEKFDSNNGVTDIVNAQFYFFNDQGDIISVDFKTHKVGFLTNTERD